MFGREAMPQLNSSASVRAYANILIPMDLDRWTVRRAKLATDLADRFSGRLIGVAAHPIPAPPYVEVPVEGVTSILEIEEGRARENLANAEAVFRTIVGSRNNVEWRQAVRVPLDHVLDQARAADLIIAARPRRNEQSFDPMSIDGGDLVMAAGRPVLFVPPHVEHLSAKRIVVGWKDTRESRRAVWDALPLLKAAQEVLVVSVETDDHAAKDVAAYLNSHGVTASAKTQPNKPPGSAAHELVKTAESELADLIVCGAYGHSRIGEWVFGGVTRDLLDHSPICCLMAH
jgi:nucleotide-binding universal stress UspA family protein